MKELEKLAKVRDRSQAIGEFLDWLRDEKNIVFSEYHDHADHCYDEEGDLVCEEKTNVLTPVHIVIEKILAEYFKIDLDQVEKERCALLDEVRSQSAMGKRET